MKTLIVYATKQGTTKQVADRLKERINGEVELFELNKNKTVNLDKYDNVILGGSIYIGKIQKQMNSFINQNLGMLQAKKLCLFICGAQKPEELEKEVENSFPSELLDKALFKGAVGNSIDMKKLNFLNRAIVKKVMGVTESYVDINDNKLKEIVNAINHQ